MEKIKLPVKNLRAGLTIVVFILFFMQCPYIYSITDPIAGKRKAVEINKEAIEALNKGKFLRAISLFENAREIIPNNNILTRNLAVAYNNYAVKLGEENNVEAAKNYFYKAIEIEPSIKQYKINLANIIYPYAQRLYQEGDYDKTVEELQEILHMLPDYNPSLILLGQIYYQKQDFESASYYWKKAKKYDPTNSDLRKLLNNVEKESKIENQLEQLDAYYFDIRFDTESLNGKAYDIRSYLKETYRDVGRDFNYYPEHKIPVILYNPKDFTSLRNTPHWVAGMFDGKIRLTIREETLTESELRRLIWHEYTHAVVLDLSGGRCPNWINEGLAKWEEGKQQALDFDPLINAVRNNTLIPLFALESNFTIHTSPEKINLAYLEAYSFIEYILNRWNFFIIKDLLEKFKEGKTEDEAFNEVLYKSPKRLNSEWKEFIRKRY